MGTATTQFGHQGATTQLGEGHRHAYPRSFRCEADKPELCRSSSYIIYHSNISPYAKRPISSDKRSKSIVMPAKPTQQLNSAEGGSHSPSASARLDKWLWAVRVYKTRSDAAEACRGSAVRLNGSIAKPSAKVRVGDSIIARTKALTRTLHVTGLTENRVGAALVPNFLEDKTPESEYEKAREQRANARVFTHKGGGRPTKKDRRDIERLIGGDEPS